MDLSPDQQFENLKQKVEESLRTLIPMETKSSKVVLHGVEFRDDKSSDDLRSQRDALVNGKSWSIPVYADVELQRGDRTVDRKKIKVMDLPKTTDRLGYIVDGNEYQVFNQFRLKSGVYHRMAPDGDAVAEFNLANNDQFANGKPFKIRFDPSEAVFYLKHRNSNVPLYPLLKSIGVDDDTLERAWGREILSKNQQKSPPEKAYGALYRAVNDKAVSKEGAQAGLFSDLLKKTKLLPETTERTLGKSYTTVDSDLLVRSTGKLLDLSRGKIEADDKNSLEFQSVHSVEDLIAGHLRRNAARIRRKAQGSLPGARTARNVVPSETFDQSLRQFFRTSLVAQSEQTNPLDMISGQLRTTIMGEQGGIRSAHAVSQDAKLINPSHLGFLDPIHTPEGEKTGITLTLPLGASKKGEELRSTFLNPKTGARVQVDPGTALQATVAFPDQYELSGQAPRARGKKVRATRDGEIVHVDPKEVDYVIPSPRALFGLSANLVPFLQNNQGNRAMTASRQQEQAVPLLFREQPLVQVESDSKKTFEEIIGEYASRRSPVDGEVVQVKKDAVIVQAPSGEKREIQVYRDFKLAGGTLYDSEIRVKAGDKVKKGDVVADSTFTKDGALALGTNLKAAYVPYFGYNFEDGIVISEEAAKKLTSLHVHQKDVPKDADTIIDRKKFLAVHPYAFKKEQLGNIDDTGLIQVGSRVKEGDPLVLRLTRPVRTKQQEQVSVFRGRRPDKFKDGTLVWGKSTPGIVTDIVQKDDSVIVYVKTEEPAQVGDKLVGRHGNKGVITRIVPQAEMPYSLDAKGEKRHIDIAMNPLGIPGRINLGQVLETAAAKVAEKEGKVYRAKNFEPGKNYLDDVRQDLKKAGLKDKEVLIDPTTDKPFAQEVLTGNQYILKLKHQAEKKLSARSGSGGEGSFYDINHAPTGGSPHGGMSMGELGLYALLAHGSRENIYEMYAYKTQKNDDLWDALREGSPIPPPKIPFAYDKFLKYMNAMRVNVRKEGNHLQLVPFTEDQIKAMSSGEIKEPGLVVRGKDLVPLKGGLFDEQATGGLDGTRWAHFNLPEPMPNPLFEDAIKKLTGLTDPKYRALVRGDVEVDGKRGGPAVEALLKKIDPAKERESLERKIKTSKGETRNKLHQRLRIVKALESEKLDPTVYMMRSVPVMPPVFRPLSVKENGSISAEDINGLYKDLGAVIDGFTQVQKAGVLNIQDQRAELYDGLRALTGLGGSLTREYRGVLDLIAGKTRKGETSEGVSKQGYFQKTVMKRRQDFSGRSIITPEPRMGLDELGLPEDIAWTMYQPFIERELSNQGYKTLDAVDEVKRRTPAAERAMQRVVQDRPVLLKRDPALHKFNVMAFKPRIVRGKAIEIHPLVTGGYNADFDGDAMSVYLPLSSKAVKEAQGMFPSNNLFSPTTGAIMFTPGHESLLGMYLLSQTGKKTDKKFATQDAALSAYRRGEIQATDVVRVGGHETTAGRLEIERALPEDLRETGKKKLSEMRIFDKKATRQVLTAIAKKHPQKYGEVANAFKDLGNDYSTRQGFSVGLDDFAVINRAERDRMFAAAEREADKIRSNRSLSPSEKENRIIAVYSKTDKRLDEMNTAELKKSQTNIYKMVVSGSRGDPVQLKQIVSTPALVEDAKNRTVPYLIPRSYSEGMDVASYWTTLHGARKGTIQKTQGVRDPGALSKLIINSTMNQLVTENNCGANDGVNLSIDDFDVVDRYLAKATRIGRTRHRAGELITPKMIAEAKKAKVANLEVRSPLRCRAEHGICKHCMGLTEAGKSYDIGTNVGVIASQSIGEPSVQLALRVFHTGGVAKGTGAQSVSLFERLDQLLKMPSTLPNAAPLAHSTGKVTKIEKAPQGGQYVYVGPTQHYVPASQEMLVKKHQKIEKGDALASGAVDPKELLAFKGVRAVQDYLASQMQGVLQTTVPVKRRNVEVVVKAMTNATKIEDPGSHPAWTVGDVVSTSQVQSWNMQNARKGQKPVQHSPIVKGVDVLPLELSEDWVARLNFQNLSRTITQAAREGWRSNIHGFHPTPAAAYAAEFGKAEQKLKPGEYKGQY